MMRQMRQTAVFLMMLIVMTIFMSACYAGTYSGGAGTSGDPYQIDNVADWGELVDDPNDWDDYFIVTSDIDFEGATIGLVGNVADGKFIYTFDGDGYTFSNAIIDNDPDARNAVALFRRIAGTAIIKDLNILNFSVTGSSPNASDRTYCGILVGESTYGCMISNCHLTNCEASLTQTTSGTVPGFLGGICGANHGDMENCSYNGGFVKGDLTGALSVGTQMHIGGVIGYQTGGGDTEISTTNNCQSSALVGSLNGTSIAHVRIGGIVGAVNMFNATTRHIVSNCTFTGTVDFTTAGQVDVGLLAGYTKGDLLDCSGEGTLTVEASIAVTNRIKIGGIIGMVNTSGDGIYSNCHVIGDINVELVNKGGSVGGITSEVYGVLSDCSYSGDITVDSSTVDSTSLIGGLFGTVQNGAAIDGCYGLVDLSVSYGTTVYVGGAVGQSFATNTIDNCYVRGTVFDASVGSNVLAFTIWGGFIAAGSGSTIQYSYAAMGPWTGQSSNREGFMGLNSSCTVTDCYWDSTVAGHTTSTAEDDPKTTAQLQDINTYASTGWTFENSNTRNWKLPADDIYPLLSWEDFSNGTPELITFGDFIGVLGAEKLTNSSFTTWDGAADPNDYPTSWDVANNDATNFVQDATSKARFVSDGASAVYIRQASVLTIGAPCLGTAIISDDTSGTIDVQNDFNPIGLEGLDTGTHRSVFTPTTATDISIIRTSGITDVTIDSLSMRESLSFWIPGDSTDISGGDANFLSQGSEEVLLQQSPLARNLFGGVTYKVSFAVTSLDIQNAAGFYGVSLAGGTAIHIDTAGNYTIEVVAGSNPGVGFKITTSDTTTDDTAVFNDISVVDPRTYSSIFGNKGSGIFLPGSIFP